MRLKNNFILTIVGLLLLNISSAQVMELTLEKARELALRNNPQVKLAAEAVKKSEARIMEARAGMLPVVSAFTSYQRAWDIQTSRMENFLKPMFDPLNYALYQAGFMDEYVESPEFLDMGFGLENTLVYGINISQPLFVGGAIWNGYQMAQNGLNISHEQLQSTEQGVLLEVTNAYNGVLFARSVVDVMRQSVNAAEKNLEQVKKFRATGKSSDFDVLRADVQLANYKPQLVSAENSAHLAVSNLTRIIGLNDTDLLFISDVLEYIPCEYSTKDFETLLETALHNRPEIAMLDEQKEIAGRQLSLARSAALPSLVFSTAYQYQGMKNDFDFTSDDFNKSFNSSLSLSVPLFSGLGNHAKIQQAKIGIKESTYQEQALRQGIKLEVEGAFYSMKEAEQNVLTQSTVIASAEEALRLANLRYAEGASTQLEVMNAEVALNQARLNYQRTLFEYNSAVAALKKALNSL